MANEFVKAEGRRIQITNNQARTIKKLYSGVLGKIDSRMKFLEKKENVSSVLRRQYLEELRVEIEDAMADVDGKIEKTIKVNIEAMSQSVVASNRKLLEKMGFSKDLCQTAYMYVPKDIVKEIISGKLYEGRWSLSRAIWNDNALRNKELETIIARGTAEQKSTFEIAKDLEKYVNPSARKDWDWSKVYPGVRRKIDYNTQRLARTMVSHAYQESFVRTTKYNPFVESYKWLRSNSDRVCPICIARSEDDQYGLGAGIFPKDELPLDHPNGMCTFVTVITKSYEQIADDLINWVNREGNQDLNDLLDLFALDLQDRNS